MLDDATNRDGSKGRGSRRAIACFIAPLAVPLLLLPWLLWQPGKLGAIWVVTAMVISAFVSYLGTLLVGIPTYFLLSRRGYTAAWIAAAAGSAIGALMWLIFSVLFALSFDQGAVGVRFALTDPHALRGVMWPGGVLGGAVGAIFWLIARPDRQTP
jgi:hypothetical protein